MAAKLVELLSPLMDELSYIFGAFNDYISYTYTLKNSGGCTSVDTFSLFLCDGIKRKDKDIIKRKFLKHSFRDPENNIIQSLTILENRVTVLVNGGTKYCVFSDIFEKEKLENPFGFKYIAKSSLKVPSTKRKKKATA